MACIWMEHVMLSLFGARFLITYDEKGIPFRKICPSGGVIGAVCVYSFLVDIFDN